jgi:hypothetical protein
VIPHWTLLFHIIGDLEYCALLIEKGPKKGIPGKQMRLIEAMEAGGDVPANLVKWVGKRQSEVDSQVNPPKW